MRFLLFVVGILCRKLKLDAKELLVFRDRVQADQLYRFVYVTRKDNKVEVSLTDPKGRRIIKTRDHRSTFYCNTDEEGEITMSVKNNGSKSMNFSYRCPETGKQTQGALGPISVDLVEELQGHLDRIIRSQRNHIKKHEQHAMMVAGSRKWVTRLLIFETLFFVGVLYFLHRDMLKMFETKRDV